MYTGIDFRNWVTITCNMTSSPRLNPPYEPDIPTLNDFFPAITVTKYSVFGKYNQVCNFLAVAYNKRV